MSRASFIKKRNRKHAKAVRLIHLAMTSLENENGPVDWDNPTHFLNVGEVELALEGVEWAIIKQDLVVSKIADDQINDAKRILGLFDGKANAVYKAPEANGKMGIAMSDLGENT